MDAALLRKINVYPTGAGRPGLDRSTDFTYSDVVEPDANMFHGADQPESVDVPEALPEPDYEAGLKDGKAQSDLMYQNTINVMQQTLTTLQSEISQIMKQIERQHLEAVQACLKAVFPALMTSGSGQELVALIKQISAQGVTGKVKLAIHPNAQEDCERLCELQAENFSIVTDATLKPQQVRVSWEQGGAEIDCDQTAQTIQKQLGEALQSLNVKDTEY